MCQVKPGKVDYARYQEAGQNPGGIRRQRSVVTVSIIFLIKHTENNRGVFCCGKWLFSHFNVTEAELKSC